MEAFRSRGFYHPCSISRRLEYSDIVITYGLNPRVRMIRVTGPEKRVHVISRKYITNCILTLQNDSPMKKLNNLVHSKLTIHKSVRCTFLKRVARLSEPLAET